MHGQTISQPYVVALMTEALLVGDRHNVIEIGTGSGYQTAILARLARRVFTIERHRELLRGAERRLDALGLRNIVYRFGDGTKGWPEQLPYDRVIVTAAAAQIPAILVDGLAPGGVLVAPVGADHHDQQLMRIRRTESGFVHRGSGSGAVRAAGQRAAAAAYGAAGLTCFDHRVPRVSSACTPGGGQGGKDGGKQCRTARCGGRALNNSARVAARRVRAAESRRPSSAATNRLRRRRR